MTAKYLPPPQEFSVSSFSQEHHKEFNVKETRFGRFNCAEAFLETFAWYNPFLSTTEQTLEYLAYQTPYIAGRAVYSARVMLGIDNLDYGILYKTDPTYSREVEACFELYPNPTQGLVVLKWTENVNAVANIVVRDIRGVIVIQLSERVINATHSIDVSSLSPGVYTVTVHQEGKPNSVQKLVVY